MKSLSRVLLVLGVGLLAGTILGRSTANLFNEKSHSYRLTRARLHEIKDVLVNAIDANSDGKLEPITMDTLNRLMSSSNLEDGWGNPFVLARHEYQGDVYYEVYSIDTKSLIRPSYKYRTIHAYVRTRNGVIDDANVSGPEDVLP